MRAIVLGSGGQLGVELTHELHNRGWSVITATRKQLDITVPAAVEALVRRHQPDWVFNTAAYNQVDLAEREPEKAMRINGLAVRDVARACQAVGAGLVHYSTDHVFDGMRDEPYTEADAPAPLSAYAVSKLAGEHFARAYCEKHMVIRVAGVFGPAGRYTNRSNFVELVLGKAAKGEPLRVVEDFFATPTYAVSLAARTVDLVERDARGIYHIGGGETISWYEYARAIAQVAGIEADISPTNHREFVTPARRPRRSSLANTRIEALGLDPMPPLAEALSDYMKKRESVEHPEDVE